MTDQRAVPASFRAETATERRVLRNDRLEAVLLPEAGGRLQRLRHVEHGDLVVPLQTVPPDFETWPKAGAFPLFPFHNRLRGGTISVGGQRIRLRSNTLNGADVLHGPAHRRPWNVTDEGPDFVEMTLDYEADEDWPFAYAAVQRMTLRETGLDVALFLRNTGDRVMPGGLGWHPYLTPPPDGRVRIDAGHEWVPDGATGAPRALRHEGGGIFRTVDNDTVQHLSDWTEAVVGIGSGTRLILAADRTLAHLVVHRKPGYICLEPVSHVAGALAALPEAPADMGLSLMEPGACLMGRLTLRIAETPA